MSELAAASRRPRSLLLTLFGAYIRDLGGWAAVAHLVSLMSDLGVDEASTRSAVSRMKKAGLLTPQRHRRAAGYALTEEALGLLAEGDALIYRDGSPPHTDDGWTLVTFSVPERQRELRHLLRSRLMRLGFGVLGSGVWLAPRHRLPHVDRMLRHTGLDRFTVVWTGQPSDASREPELVREAWDLSEIAAPYREFLETHRDQVDRWQDQGTGSDRDAFIAYVPLLAQWRLLPFSDPGLPGSLLPPDWPGEEARRLFEMGRRRLAARGAAYVARGAT